MLHKYYKGLIILICTFIIILVYQALIQKSDPNVAIRVFINNSEINDWVAQRHAYQKLVQQSNTVPILQPKFLCQSETKLVIIVCSSIGNFLQRRAIRDTWGIDVSQAENTLFYFLVGTTNNSKISDDLQEESQKYSDIIQYDFMENYLNLTIKSVLLLKWIVNYCNIARYVMKVDDDVFLHIPNIVKYIEAAKDVKLMIGTLSSKVTPVKNPAHKWFMPINEYPEPMYPDYLTGGAYILGNYAVSELYNNSLKIPFIRIEDVFITGLCARYSGLKPRNHDKFLHIKLNNNPCLFRTLFSVHSVSVVEMYKVWSQVFDPRFICHWWSKWIYWE
ncbi:beta-1,3-galactosyltransferase 5-like [Centruroides sculpturatus]|uniref:beta-1,3-galactosyltransferase 5-like n=1 Tax=Centruroides sculpturatus TaxID=218467 RepID=UPI000C6E8082|nr:beta-1,3-galactosyltransferase 5-like [Centruroides sculpturatus]